MNKIIVFIFICLLNFNYLYATDFGIETDKLLHFSCSYIATDIVQEKFKLNFIDSFMFITIVSFMKEYIDKQTGGRFDITDIYYNYYGFLFNYIIKI